MYILFSFILISYISILFLAIFGWNKTQKKYTRANTLPFCSIVISARNEVHSIHSLLENLQNQDYPHHLFEIIIANDHSTDGTEELILNSAKKYDNIALHSLPDMITGKKKALQYILPFTKGDLLFFTDADCEIPTKWLSTYVNFITHNSGDFYFGSVTHHTEKNILQKCFTLDFLSIVAVQAGLAKINKAFSCNAANMCITRKFYETSYNNNNKFASGDDVFLLHEAKKTQSNNVHFIHNKETIVTTYAPKTLSLFINQRIRWSSKTSGYTDITAILVSFIIYATNLTLFSTSLFALFTPYFTDTFWKLFAIKTICDIVFFSITLPYFKKQHLLWLVIPFQFIYIIYITIIPIFAILVPISWKGRKIK